MTKIYSATVEYMRRDGTALTRYFEVEAGNPSQAAARARNLFTIDWRHRNSKITCIRVVPVPMEAEAEPAPIENGDVLTLNIVGAADVQPNGDVVLTSARGKSIRFQREFVEQQTGRKVVVEKVEYYSIYPNGAQYASDRPIKNSQYGVENLIQVKVTKRDGRIVKKEFV